MSLADKFAMDMQTYFGCPKDNFRREKYSSVVDNNQYVRLSDRLHNGDAVKRAKQSPFKDYSDKAVNHESVEKADHETHPNEVETDRNPVEAENKIPVKDASGKVKRNTKTKKVVNEMRPEDMTGSGADNQAGAMAFSNKGLKAGAMAFNEKELINQISALKKGDKIGSGAMTTALLSTLIQTAPQIISAIKSARKAEGGAAKCTPKFAGAYDTFVKQLDPSKYDNLESLCKQIVSQKKNLKDTGAGECEIGTGKFGTFMSNAWNKLKEIYGSEGFKPIRNALKTAATNYANSYIDKTANKIADKTQNEDLKNIVNTTRDVAKNVANETINATGAGNLDSMEGAGNQEQKYLVSHQSTAVENIQDDEYNTDDLVKKKEAKISRKKRAVSPDKGVNISHVNIGTFNKVPQKSVFL